MSNYRFVTVDVFTDRRFGGNPLAVFPDAFGLSDAEMQSLANEFNLSETTFVLPPDDPAHTARVRIFNTTSEMPFAGHPNVGTGFVLARLGRDTQGVLLFEEPAGLVAVHIDRGSQGEIIGATIDAPQDLSLGLELSPEAVAICAGLTPSDMVISGHRPITASTGNPFVIAQVSSEALSRASPDATAFRRTVAHSPRLDGRLAIYLYCFDGSLDHSQIRARMFAPLSGTHEDAATGSAATPLAGLLLSLSGDSAASYEIRQGIEMGRPSLLKASARRTAGGIRASVGGACVPVLQGEAAL